MRALSSKKYATSFRAGGIAQSMPVIMLNAFSTFTHTDISIDIKEYQHRKKKPEM